MPSHAVRTALILIGTAMTLSGCSLFKKSQATETTKPPVNEPVNVIDFRARPYISITPRNDAREITLNIHNLNQEADELEFELEYQSGSLLQGTFGAFDLKADTPPVSQDILLGSCSAGGACTYHQDVTGGSLTMRFRGPQNYVLKTQWRFQQTNQAAGQFSSRDSKLQLDAATALNRSGVVIIGQSSGLPAPLEADPLSEPYFVEASLGLPDDQTAELSLRLNQDASAATIYGWDGSDWQPFDTVVSDKTATATVDLLPLYIAAR